MIKITKNRGDEMNQKYAVVTGASKGIGYALAERLLEEGYVVYGISRKPGSLETVKWMTCDVTDQKSVEQIFTEIIKVTGRIDLLICNAGIGISGAAEFTSEADYVRQMEVNFMGAVHCALQAAPLMRQQRAGKILFISSLAAIFPLPFQSFYSASKAAVNAFSDALGLELRPFGVETSTLMLNDVKTEFTNNRRKTATGDDIYEGRIGASVEKMEASERSGMPADQVAKTACKLLRRNHLPSHKIVGISNEFLGFLCRILPTNLMLYLLGKIYG